MWTISALPQSSMGEFGAIAAPGWVWGPIRLDDFLKTRLSAQPVTISQAIEGYQMVNPYRRFERERTKGRTDQR
jgi:hypothetical protein